MFVGDEAKTFNKTDTRSILLGRHGSRRRRSAAVSFD